MDLENLQCDAAELCFFCLVDDIGEVLTNHRLVCRNLNDIESINLTELILFGLRGTGHTGELCVEAEVVLDGNGRHRLLLVLDLDAFFGFHSLVKTIRPAAAKHDTSRELIHDTDFRLAFLTLAYDIVAVAVEDGVCFQRCICMLHVLDILKGRNVFDIKSHAAQLLFNIDKSLLREVCGLLLLIDNVVFFVCGGVVLVLLLLAALEHRHDAGEDVVEVG